MPLPRRTLMTSEYPRSAASRNDSWATFVWTWQTQSPVTMSPGLHILLSARLKILEEMPVKCCKPTLQLLAVTTVVYDPMQTTNDAFLPNYSTPSHNSSCRRESFLQDSIWCCCRAEDWKKKLQEHFSKKTPVEGRQGCCALRGT